MSLPTLRTIASWRPPSPLLWVGLSFAAHCLKMPCGCSSSFDFCSEKRPTLVWLIRAGLLVIMQTGQSAVSRICSSGLTISSLKSMEPKMKSASGTSFSSLAHACVPWFKPRLNIETSRSSWNSRFSSAAADLSALLFVGSIVMKRNRIGKILFYLRFGSSCMPPHQFGTNSLTRPAQCWTSQR